ncbi:hypothetical protein JHK87_046427 [Glycine soja]|nr:hypothetical protein JHK87_046427 [Glycine soja]
MYSSPSQFDGNAAFSGGGFMPSQTTQGPDSSLVPSKVTLVGRVSNKTGRITDVTFVLDDGTGRIECSKWLHEAVDTNEAEAIFSRNELAIKNLIDEGAVYETIGDHNKSIING